MRWTTPAVALALCACSREASFDERYSNSEMEIEQRARELDTQLNDTNASGRQDGSGEIG
jgi:hypothetical protein